MPITRRTALGGGLLTVGLLAVGGVGLGLQSTRQREPRSPLGALTPTQFSVLAWVADTMMPGTDAVPDAWTLRVPEKVDAMLASTDAWLAAEIGQALLLLENAVPGLLLDGRPVPFSQADAETRARTLERWRTSRIPLRRSAFRALHGLCAGSYWSDPATRAVSGYPGPPNYGNTQGAFPHPPLFPEPEATSEAEVSE